MNLPNRITLTRICLIPVFAAVFYIEAIPYNFLISAVLFLLAASTDFLDGYIARKRGLVTNLGKFLDPIADKVLISTAMILLLTRPLCFQAVGGWGIIAAGGMVALILARELIVSGFRMIAAGQNVVLAADNLGKLKTVAQDFAMSVLIMVMPFLDTKTGEVFNYIGLAAFALSAVLTVWSGINYIVKNREVLKD
ncbi:MAG: CDP-diacylglycerol--glycerol-3-phosphate 3-phosphatidyltransferase [Clostridia bacterium]|jgi:CDP-diacylglycerol--glycerol-3-phosphate 3-phosphatidyltransferase|nr:CDP-diacylglycerol--glycerol-3-phosphate 3-phosphatidyltransferase [Clostridia bacterium]